MFDLSSGGSECGNIVIKTINQPGHHPVTDSERTVSEERTDSTRPTATVKAKLCRRLDGRFSGDIKCIIRR